MSAPLVGPSMAEVCREWCAIEEQEDDALAAALGCRTEDLIGLFEELRPAPETFEQDVRAIAERRGFDAGGLAQVIRRVDVVTTMLAGDAAVAKWRAMGGVS